MDPAEALIRIRNVYKCYGQEQVLKGVNLDVLKGETLLVFGGSGVGKSVLLRLMNGLEKPDQGDIRVEGTDIVPLDENHLKPIRKKIGFLFQGSALFDAMTVEENIALPLLEHTDLGDEQRRQLVRNMLELVELKFERDHWKRSSELSGGMKRRVSLARTLIMKPDIVLYDEPTTGLDPVKADTICRLIKRLQLQQGITSVVVTHDIVAADKIADRMAMLFDGQIIISDKPDIVKNSTNLCVRQFLLGDSRLPADKGNENHDRNY